MPKPSKLFSELSKLPDAYLWDAWVLACDPALDGNCGLALFDESGGRSDCFSGNLSQVEDHLFVLSDMVNLKLLFAYEYVPHWNRARDMRKAGNDILAMVKTHFARRNKCFRIHPKTWQSAVGVTKYVSTCKQNGVDTKFASLEIAKLTYPNVTDHNVADALNIGDYFFSELEKVRNIRRK